MIGRMIPLILAAPCAAWAFDPPADLLTAMDLPVTQVSNIGPALSDPRMFKVLPNLGGYQPMEGSTLAMISTGLADFYNTSSLGQPDPVGAGPVLAFDAEVPAGAQSLRFDWVFCTHEYPEWVGSIYNDWVEVFLSSGAYSGQILFDPFGNLVSVNSALPWVTDPSLLVGTGVGPDSPNGDGACTTWLWTEAPVVGGETIQLEFNVGSASDGVWDSWMLLDNFLFDGPEPSPSLQAVDPPSADLPSTLPVRLLGQDLQAAVSVQWGDLTLDPSQFTVVNNGNTIAIPSLPSAAAAGRPCGGAIEVGFTWAEGTVTLPAAFTYTRSLPAPVASLLTPGRVAAEEDAQITLAGVNFVEPCEDDGSNVLIDGAQAPSVAVLAPDQIEFVAPAHVAGTVEVIVRNPDGQESGPILLSYEDPDPSDPSPEDPEDPPATWEGCADCASGSGATLLVGPALVGVWTRRRPRR